MTLTFNDIEFFNAGIVTTDTEGDGAITLGAAVSGYNPSGIPDTGEGLSTYLWIRKDGDYEILRCTIASSVATVVEVVESTNGGAKVNWGAGEKTVVAMTAKEVFELIGTKFAGSMGVVLHGADADVARPTGYGIIQWIGSVDPTNKEVNDLWIDTT